MIEVLPAINCPDRDFDCLSHKLKVAEGFADMVHLDVADGTFTFNKTWAAAEHWPDFGTRLKLEVHLMVDRP